MYRIFLAEHTGIKVFYKVFQSKFKPEFGLPRSDTCGTCDRYQSCLSSLDNPEKKRALTIQKEQHLRKADKFYELKRKYKLKARMDPENYTGLSFDYMQNLPLPHIRTNAVFYARQLWYFVFGIHKDGENSATMNCYHEAVGRKGQNEVASLLFH